MEGAVCPTRGAAGGTFQACHGALGA
eukprot:SAG22_NODE_4106_length_1384_cov_1.414786_1_plen_25_part_10